MESFRRVETRVLLACMALLALAVGWLLSTRPVHRVEGDFLAVEDRRDANDPWLLARLNDQKAHVRGRACLALGRIGDPSSLDALIDGLRDHGPTVRAAAAYAIGLHQDLAALDQRGLDPAPSAAVALLKAVGDEERMVVTNAVEALGKMGWKSAWEAATKSPAPVPVTLAALARMKEPQAIPWIVERLKSDDPEIRLTAVAVLYELEAPLDAGLQSEIVRLAKDRNNWVRIAAAALLSRAEPGEEIKQRLLRLLSAADPKERIAALAALGRLRMPDTLSYLVTALGDPVENVRVAALRALGDYGDPGVAGLLNDLRGKNERSSYEAERTLARVARTREDFLAGVDTDRYITPEGVAALAEALAQHPLEGVREPLDALWRREDDAAEVARPRILRALVSRLGDDAAPYIDEGLGSGNSALRAMALDLWPAPEPDRCREIFERARAAGDTSGQRAALDAAARAAGGDEQKQLLLDALGDGNRLVRLRAVRHLRHLYGEDHDEAVGTAAAFFTLKDYQAIARKQRVRLRMETTVGTFDLVVDFYEAPRTAENFLRLAQQGFFDNQRFLVYSPNRFVQAGDPRGDGYGGPGYTIPSEINGQPFLRGSLGMAVSEKDTGGSQFFLCLTPQPLLEGRYTNFGRLVSGDAVIDQIHEEIRILKVRAP